MLSMRKIALLPSRQRITEQALRTMRRHGKGEKSRSLIGIAHAERKYQRSRQLREKRSVKRLLCQLYAGILTYFKEKWRSAA